MTAISKLKVFLNKISCENPKKAKSLSEKRTMRDFNIIKKWLWGNKILDYGCGSGKVALAVSKRLKKEVVLTDIKDRNETSLPFYLCDFKKAPFVDNYFDTVLMMNVLHHTGNAHSLIKEAARVSRRRIVVFEQHLYRKKESRGLSWREWKRLVLFEEQILRGGENIFENNFFELYHLWRYNDIIKLFRHYRLKLVFKKFIPPFFKNIFVNQGWLFVLDKN